MVNCFWIGHLIEILFSFSTYYQNNWCPPLLQAAAQTQLFVSAKHYWTITQLFVSAKHYWTITRSLWNPTYIYTYYQNNWCPPLLQAAAQTQLFVSAKHYWTITQLFVSAKHYWTITRSLWNPTYIYTYYQNNWCHPRLQVAAQSQPSVAATISNPPPRRIHVPWPRDSRRYPVGTRDPVATASWWDQRQRRVPHPRLLANLSRLEIEEN